MVSVFSSSLSTLSFDSQVTKEEENSKTATMQKSTEQLTSYSLETLEEIAAEKPSEPAGRCLESAMGFCRSSRRWIVLPNLAIAVFMMILLSVLEFGIVPYQQIGFYCNDPKIAFKFTGDTVSLVTLILGSAILPLLAMWLVEWFCHSPNSYKSTIRCTGIEGRRVWYWYGQYTVGFVVLTFICEVAKLLVGEPRPHFLDTCRPRESLNCTNEYIGSYTCTNTDDSNWFVSDSSKSFPSGHSAFSMFTTVFVIWYLQIRLPNSTFLVKPWFQCIFTLWGITCSLTRIVDHRHHWWDVLAGDLLGAFLAWYVVVTPCRKFTIDDIDCCTKNLEADNRIRTDFGTKSSNDNVKSLIVNPVSIEVPENKDTRNVTNWKE